MFTGIVQHRGSVAEAIDVPFGRKLVIDAAGWRHLPAHGESICVNGVCLTCTSHEGRLAFDVIAQTLQVTTLGGLRAGSAVNLEPCVTAHTLLSGHIVQGHVDAVGVIVHRKQGADEVRLAIEPPPGLMDYIVPKGSIAVDGASMTLAEVHEKTFELALIPTTLELTTLGLVQPGDRVNLEADVLVKTIVHTMRRMFAEGGSDWQAAGGGGIAAAMARPAAPWDAAGRRFAASVPPAEGEVDRRTGPGA